MVGHGGSSAGLYLADPTSPIPSHCASIVVTSTLRVKNGLVSSGKISVLSLAHAIHIQHSFIPPGNQPSWLLEGIMGCLNIMTCTLNQTQTVTTSGANWASMQLKFDTTLRQDRLALCDSRTDRVFLHESDIKLM